MDQVRGEVPRSLKRLFNSWPLSLCYSVFTYIIKLIDRLVLYNPASSLKYYEYH
ncbi:hypothetical protein L873DRAFT_1803158 [Choiromyces venosus 120613-1]|uniref:Uncharacterized protein n=1 Tax=Choiromyces venosus 120613-1 TaxID=1336337 RepID=A0A3N4JU23_9PEZI|nr:hypothetical protein L873DRAFT_1803158 [Choiromyces venosus 120613-1]